MDIVDALSTLEDTGTSTAGVANDILLIAQELLILHNQSTTIPISCKEIKERQPLSLSGVYLLSNTSSTYTAYCNMKELCNSNGGWTRLAYLDISDATQNCPSGFGLYQSGGVRACGKKTLHNGCISVQFPSHNISYSQVCGRVIGYLYGSIDGLVASPDIIVEGAIITHGPSRQHVWSLMAGNSEVGSSSNSCPCNTGSTVSVPPSIGNNYFCESGNPTSGNPSQILYTSDPLWDGQGCGSNETACCNAPGIPWFHRDYGSNTFTDYIELRVCANYHDEDTPINYYEIFVK
uniref:Fibrinogen C-terminal domain-containing protein n=1 Tax=Amphimedon queenslandica TaxID=400682 RepID=A0A1X7UX54_AMPQE